MSIRHYVAAAVAALFIVGCESGDVVLSPTNVDNSVDNSVSGGGGGANPCASYQDPDSGDLRQGAFDGTNCIYSGAFVSQQKPLKTDVTIPFITGAHMFEESLIVGENVDNQTVANPVPGDGEGPTLTIAPGATLAFQDSGDYLGVMRGSRIEADGTAQSPITFTAWADILGNVDQEAVQLWAGVIISGSGITNNCTNTERADGTCGVLSEGDNFSFYGGDDNAESSGTLRYVIIKHTGFGPSGNEIQALTLNAVGSGTVIENIQAFASADDGIEFFGGAVNVTNYIGMYLQDDSLDYTDGYIGTIQNALIIQAQFSGNRCVEGDGIGESRYEANEDPLLALPYTNPTISNMTCILSNAEPAGSDESEGPTTRRGPQSQMASSIIWGAYSDDSDSGHECFEMNDPETLQFAEDGDSTLIDSLIACEEAVKGTLNNTDALSDWAEGLVTANGDYSFNTNNTIIQEADIFANGNLNVLDCFYTDTTLIDNSGVDITANYPNQLGAVTRADDWTQPWAIGLDPADLWFPCP